MTGRQAPRVDEVAPGRADGLGQRSGVDEVQMVRDGEELTLRDDRQRGVPATLEQSRDAMFSGVHINTSEDRAVLHTALRLPRGAELDVDGQNVVSDVHDVLDRMGDFTDRLRSGEWTGATGQRITTVVNIGIGGSDLGPVMVYEALRHYADAGISARFVSNVDPADLVAKERGIAEATAREEGKPEQALPKIVEGRLNGFFKEVALLDQPSVTENKKSVKAVLDAAGTTVKRFVRFEVGA